MSSKARTTREPSRFEPPWVGSRSMRRTKDGRYVKHEALLDLRGQLIEAKQDGFEVVKKLSATLDHARELEKKLAAAEVEIQRLRGQSEGLVLALKVANGREGIVK